MFPFVLSDFSIYLMLDKALLQLAQLFLNNAYQ